MHIMLWNGCFKGQWTKPAGLWGVGDFSEQGESSLISLVGRALLCTEQLTHELVDYVLSPREGNSPRPGKALAGRAQHQEPRRAPGQDMTTQLLAALQQGHCWFG